MAFDVPSCPQVWVALHGRCQMESRRSTTVLRTRGAMRGTVVRAAHLLEWLCVSNCFFMRFGIRGLVSIMAVAGKKITGMSSRVDNGGSMRRWLNRGDVGSDTQRGLYGGAASGDSGAVRGSCRLLRLGGESTLIAQGQRRGIGGSQKRLRVV